MMNKYIYLVVIFISFFQINIANSNEKIAFIDLDNVIQNTNIGKEVLNNINNLDKKNIETLKKKIKKLKIKI